MAVPDLLLPASVGGGGDDDGCGCTGCGGGCYISTAVADGGGGALVRSNGLFARIDMVVDAAKVAAASAYKCEQALNTAS